MQRCRHAQITTRLFIMAIMKTNNRLDHMTCIAQKKHVGENVYWHGYNSKAINALLLSVIFVFAYRLTG